MDILLVVETRLEVVKMAPIIRAIQQQGQPLIFVHSGQHYDYSSSLQFIEELVLRKPDHSLRVEEGVPTAQTGRMVMTLEKSLKRKNLG
jgi:UDP-N-acetylglucosamine 2-epimerase (non-hydrolysing)